MGEKMRVETLTMLVTGELQLRIELIASESYIRVCRSDIDETVVCWEETLNKLGWYCTQDTHSWATLCVMTVDGDSIYRTSFSLHKGVKKQKKPSNSSLLDKNMKNIKKLNLNLEVPLRFFHICKIVSSSV